MENRNISHNIRNTLDLMNYAEQNNIEAVIISLDFEKAFDRVELKSLIGTLRYFNFGENFMRWTKLLYQDIIHTGLSRTDLYTKGALLVVSTSF